ncbi:MAG: hypothetical protein DHS80DRAFT_21754 [Piptocephalis tieghemiana]|nr:MAG: hypothetical protein DHS80DRAFT_21754 [Piptocephalis tieghemiana]
MSSDPIASASQEKAEFIDLTHFSSESSGKKRSHSSMQEGTTTAGSSTDLATATNGSSMNSAAPSAGSSTNPASTSAGSSGPPPAKRPNFTCAICLSPPEHMTATSCGHIFCYRCILHSIRYASQCPVCRKRQIRKELVRLYASLRPLPPISQESQTSKSTSHLPTTTSTPSSSKKRPTT